MNIGTEPEIGQKETQRAARNREKLAELYPHFADSVRPILSELEAAGFRPRIQVAWRSPEEELKAYKAGISQSVHGMHGISGRLNQPESLAADVVENDDPDAIRIPFALQLASSAQAHSCQTGILMGLPHNLAEAVTAAIARGDWGARVKLGWNPLHVQAAGLSLGEARAGKRPGGAPAGTTPPRAGSGHEPAGVRPLRP
ncbi:MAG: hypothetical protein HZB25_08090 [Candidatus Eisenbacteria bacterium]|nr:hypothetical protein [Candidatus Eisenbacteria bacterium]